MRNQLPKHFKEQLKKFDSFSETRKSFDKYKKLSDTLSFLEQEYECDLSNNLGRMKSR